MIQFPFSLFSDTPDFPLHLQYGFHEEDDCYLHEHADFSELVVVLEGSATHIVNEERYPIAKGDVFVINQFTRHGFTEAAHLRICNMMFQPERLFADAYDMKQLPGFQALFILEPHYFRTHRFCSQLQLRAGAFNATEQLISQMMAQYTERTTGWQDAASALFRLLCVQLSREYRTQEAVDGMDNAYLKLAGAVAYMENHYCTAIGTEQLAAIAGYSERQFLRLFKTVFGTTPNQYIVGLRMKKAQQLLKDTELSIGEIAWRCGYDDHNYFSRLFKKQVGVTPRAYQKFA